MTDPELLSRFTVVLWRPGSPGNVGSVARAMKNMGFTRLSIAEPRLFDEEDYFRREAARMAWDAEDILESRMEYPTMDEALSGATLVAGTTWKAPDGYDVLPPRPMARALLEAARKGPVALLFGQESIGLTREAMTRCQLLGTVPASGLYGSLNLAQAALLFLYEIRMAALDNGAGAGPSSEAPGAEIPPTRGEIESFYRRLDSALEGIGFFEGTSREHMTLEVRKLFNRSVKSRRELSILEGIVHRIRLGRPRRGDG